MLAAFDNKVDAKLIFEDINKIDDFFAGA